MTLFFNNSTSQVGADEVKMAEQAAVSAAPGAGNGIIWVKDDTPNKLYFTDDAGTDFDLTATGSGSPGGSNTQIQYNNAGAFGGDSGFTTNGAGSVNITGDLDVDNLNLNGNTLSSTNANGAIIITPNGTGAIQADSSGDTRGTDAIDFQSNRSDNAQVASGDFSFIAGGNKNKASGNLSFATGYYCYAIGTYAFCQGYSGGAYGASSHKEGDNSKAEGDQSHAEGRTTTAAGFGSHTEGEYSAAVAVASHVEGSGFNSTNNRITCCGPYGHVEGKFTRIGPRIRQFTVSGTTVTIAGVDVTADFVNGNICTFFNLSGGTNLTLFVATRTISAVAFGTDTTFTINSALDDRTGGWVGNTGNTTFSGIGAHAEGYSSNTSATVAATGIGSHVEGACFNTASRTTTGRGSHAEGYSRDASTMVASGLGSHVEGYTKTGQSNAASGKGSHAEGSGTTASGDYAHAGGMLATASRLAQWSRASGAFSTAGDGQISILTVRNITTNNTQTELFINGSSTRIAIPADTTWAFMVLIGARRTDANDESAAYKIEGCIDNNAGTTALVGAILKTILAEDTAAWDATVEADDTNDALVVRVTGETSKTIRWLARVDLVEITG